MSFVNAVHTSTGFLTASKSRCVMKEWTNGGVCVSYSKIWYNCLANQNKIAVKF